MLVSLRKLNIKKIGRKSGFIGAIFVAAVVGGLSTALVHAGIPDSGGTIHACYKTKNGNLNVIDTDNGGTCTSKETAVNWSQNGAQVLYDANGQVLGDLLIANAGAGISTWQVYNHTLGRVMPINYTFNYYLQDNEWQYGVVNSPNFESSDCTGQAYVPADQTTPIKITLWQWSSGSSTTYAIVQDSATPGTVTLNSYLPGDGSACQTESPIVTSAFPYSVVSLPFTTPLATPFKL